MTTPCLAAVLGSALACAAAAQPAAAEPAQIGEWRFDEGAGRAVVDSGPHGLTGRLGASGEPGAADPVRVAGLSGGALQFDGHSYVRPPDRAELDPQTLFDSSRLRRCGSARRGPHRARPCTSRCRGRADRRTRAGSTDGRRPLMWR